LSVKPGLTGLSQLAFARESQILDSDDPLTDYVERLLPLKIELDRLYAQTHSLRLDLRILVWTVVAVGLQRDVAVNRRTARISIRRRPAAVGPAKVETVER
jgi:lipopolysaccharide/colanic/teichoic acid biosynthesis glycosyltransferase